MQVGLEEDAARPFASLGRVLDVVDVLLRLFCIVGTDVS